MAYTTVEARDHLLAAVADAADELGYALASLGEAYEQLDEFAAERLEQALFRPVQLAYGRARRTHTDFADRYGLSARTFEPQAAGRPSSGARGFIDSAVEAVARADATLVALQDSMLPVEVGDAKTRAGIAEVRELLDGLRGQARELERTLGR